MLDRLARAAARRRPPAPPARAPGSTTSAVRRARRAAERPTRRIYRAVAEVTGSRVVVDASKGPALGAGARRGPRHRPADAQRRPRPTGRGLVVEPPRRPTARHLRQRADVADPGAPVRGAVERAPAGDGGHRVRLGGVPVGPAPLRGLRRRPGRGPWSPRRQPSACPLRRADLPAVDGGDGSCSSPATACPATPGGSAPARSSCAATTAGPPRCLRRTARVVTALTLPLLSGVRLSPRPPAPPFRQSHRTNVQSWSST